MAFCSYCGRQLNEGEVCTCRQQNNPVAQQPPVQQFTQQPPVQQYGQQIPVQQGFQPTAQKPQIQLNLNPNLFVEFIKNYFKNPNEAVRLGAKNKDIISMLIFGLAFVFTNGLAQAAIGIKLQMTVGINLSTFSFILFVFGLLFGVFGMALPAVLNIVGCFINKKELSKKEFIGKSILHTPITSVLLFLSFAFCLISYKLAFFMFVMTAVVYVISMLSSVLEVLNEGMIQKLMAFGMAFLFIAFFAILILIEFACLKGVASNYFYNMLDFFF